MLSPHCRRRWWRCRPRFRWHRGGREGNRREMCPSCEVAWRGGSREGGEGPATGYLPLLSLPRSHPLLSLLILQFNFSPFRYFLALLFSSHPLSRILSSFHFPLLFFPFLLCFLFSPSLIFFIPVSFFFSFTFVLRFLILSFYSSLIPVFFLSFSPPSFYFLASFFLLPFLFLCSYFCFSHFAHYSRFNFYRPLFTSSLLYSIILSSHFLHYSFLSSLPPFLLPHYVHFFHFVLLTSLVASHSACFPFFVSLMFLIHFILFPSSFILPSPSLFT